ncbi:hypothetical protein F4810DRAFT_708727 [Camillea tinctor]|nr:hypothetical protein F4810DRAFT_708727 [Camillea tinctor]
MPQVDQSTMTTVTTTPTRTRASTAFLSKPHNLITSNHIPTALTVEPVTLAPTTTSITTRICGISYTIRKGDTCSSLAARANISVDTLLGNNPQLDRRRCADRLPEGLVVCVPTAPCAQTHRVGSGDTCERVGAAYGLSTAQLVALNPRLRGRCVLRRGSRVCVGARGRGQGASTLRVVPVSAQEMARKNASVVSRALLGSPGWVDGGGNGTGTGGGGELGVATSLSQSAIASLAL